MKLFEEVTAEENFFRLSRNSCFNDRLCRQALYFTGSKTNPVAPELQAGLCSAWWKPQAQEQSDSGHQPNVQQPHDEITPHITPEADLQN
ncbi:MAG: hypothetical protein WCB11_22810, partial [Terriglobales bacterium]